MEAKKINAAKKKGGGPDERAFKDRVGGFISVGGGVSYVHLALPLMNFFTFPLNIKVVDQMPLSGVWYGSVGLIGNASIMARARKLGRNVTRSMGQPPEQVKWMGDEMGTCPACHSNLLVVRGNNPVECPICGIRGKIKTAGNKVTVHFSDEELKRSRLTISGLLEHWHELQGYASKSKKIKNKDILAKKLEKYIKYAEPQ